MKLQVLVRVVLLSLACLWLSASAVRAESPDGLRAGLAEMRAYRWDNALSEAAKDGPLARDIIEWHRLRAGHGDYDEVSAFLTRRPDWPGLALLRKNSEKALIGRTGREVLDFFAETEPQTPTGKYLYALALERAGQGEKARQVVTGAWRADVLNQEEFRAFFSTYGDWLTDHHVARMDAMLWAGRDDQASDMLSLVPDGWQRLYEARTALRNDRDGVDGLISAVPAALSDDPGLAYERMLWRIRKDRDAEAAVLLDQRSGSAASLGRPEKWSDERLDLTRQTLWDGDARLAYRLASRHHLAPTDTDYAELEWLAGYIALQSLGQADTAARHFRAMQASVDSPISQARAGYWLGRAFEAAGNATAAQDAYAQAAHHGSAYYGLLAADRAGEPPHLDFDTSGLLDWRAARFTKSSVFHAGLMTLSLGDLYLAERFFVQLSEFLDDQELLQLGQMLEDLTQPHLALRVAKHGVRQDEMALNPYFPLHPVADYGLPVKTELVLSIARRESEFDPTVASRAGAKGLLQLMPGTATDMARELGVPVEQDRLVTDWRYNAALGSTYLARLVEQFDGNPVLVAAAYNAGPNRVVQWLDTLGDPRSGRVDIIDWIEAIPYRETRNYVMRVTEGLPAYRARLGLPVMPQPFVRELAGSGLLPLSP
jgi:soluble lytic murein transglycosylase